MALEYAQIRAILPQGHPMVLVDRVLSLEPHASIVGIKAITASEPCYRDLPGGLALDRYAYPVSLLLESFGQTAAILWLKSVPPVLASPDRLLMFAAARECRISGRAFPGEVLQHRVRLDHIVGDNVFVEGETWVGNRRIAVIGSMLAAARERSVVLEHARSNGQGQAALAAVQKLGG
jgi:3-hydroxyacyl-[acyl-carrier-protein] dehydratase